MSAEAARAWFRAQGVSRETIEALDIYVEALKRWNRRINLIGRATEEDIWSRHIIDSAQLMPLIPEDSARIADFGSGAGLPGLVLAIMAPEQRAHNLVESDKRKSAFLRDISTRLGLRVTLLADRIEAIPPLDAPLITARGLAPLNQLLYFMERHGRPGCRALFHKGKTVDREITDARDGWNFDLTRHVSVVDPSSTILEISGLERRS